MRMLKSGGNMNNLPKLPLHVGGDTDLMIGVQYLKYYPEKIFELPYGMSKIFELPYGMSIYKSQCVSS